MTDISIKSPLWTPSPERVAQSNLTRFMGRFGESAGQRFGSYDDLWQYSVDHIEDFWRAVWDASGIIHSQPYDCVVEGAEIHRTTWFPGARLNFAENLLRFRDNHTAIIAEAETGVIASPTYAELHDQVARCAHGLRALGVREGDRVAAFIPNIPEAVIAMLATTSLGAIWSSCSPDFGLQGVLDRFGQIEPKVLFTADSYHYNGHRIDCLDKVAHIARSIPAIEHIVVVSRSDSEERTSGRADNKTGQLGSLEPDSLQAEFPDRQPSTTLRMTGDASTLPWASLLNNTATEIEFAQLPFDHPVYIMYSSGTTGVPKCMVHGAGGTLLQHYKEHALHTDLRRDDVITYYTTCGWMMWNWLVSALQIGATMYIYDGSPSHPTLDRLWRAVERHKITVFGTSPKFLSACETPGLTPRTKFDLSSLRTILSTGSPLSEKNFAWVYQNIGADLQLASISGGTDIISCFMLGCPILPVYPGEIQCRGLGMKVATFDDSGRSVTGQVGELVCTERFPSRPVFFWNDPDGRKYHDAYFDHYPGVWRHGDYIEITETGGIIVYGRSDATLNPGGVRIGTAEIYTPVEALPEIVDSIVVGQQWRNDVRIILFVQLAPGLTLTDSLKEKIRAAIRSRQTPRHVPAKIIAVDRIPHTINGKKVELAVTRVIHGKDVPNRDALADPSALDPFRDLAELREA